MNLMQLRSCQGLPGEPEILRVNRHILFYCALLYCTSQVLCLLQMEGKILCYRYKFCVPDVSKERGMFNTSEYGEWKCLLIKKMPTQKMRELNLKFILGEPKFRHILLSREKREEPKGGCGP